MGLYLSIEIDDNNIKILEVSKKGDVLSILKCMSLCASSVIDDSKISDVNFVAELVKEAIIINNIKAKKVVIVINSSSVITRKIKLPLLNKKTEVLSMIKLELEQLVPADLSQYKIMYKVIDIVCDNDVKSAFYVIYCLPEAMFNNCKELARILKLKLVCIDISFNCLNKIINHDININDESLDFKKVNAFININSHSISFCVLNEGNNDFSRISFNNEIDKYTEIAAEGEALYNCDESYDSSILLSKILDEVSKFIRYYYSIDNSNINKLYVYGEFSRNRDIIKYLSLHLKIDVVAINHISNIQFLDMSLKVNFEIDKYLVLILSLFNDKKDINLSRPYYFDYIYDIKFNIVVISIIIFIMSWIFIAWKYSNILLEYKINDMNLYINDEDNLKRNDEIESLKVNIILLEEHIEDAKKLKSLINNEDYVSSIIFRELFYAIPENTRVTSISVDRNNTNLSCVSASMEEATLFLQNIRKIDFIDSIYLPSIEVNQEGVSGYSYSIMCILQDVSAHDN